MSFWFGYELKELLFSSINITTITGFVGACACTIGLVLVLEITKIGLAYSNFYSEILRRNQNASNDCYTDDMFLVENHVPSNRARFLWLLFEVTLYIVELVLGYMIMLLVMSYNVYLLLSVLLGTGIGYFLGGQILMTMKLKISKLQIPCNQCTTLPKNSSITSSTEAISENALNEEQESKCCLRDTADDDDDDEIEEETRY